MLDLYWSKLSIISKICLTKLSQYKLFFFNISQIIHNVFYMTKKSTSEKGMKRFQWKMITPIISSSLIVLHLYELIKGFFWFLYVDIILDKLSSKKIIFDFKPILYEFQKNWLGSQNSIKYNNTPLKIQVRFYRFIHLFYNLIRTSFTRNSLLELYFL